MATDTAAVLQTHTHTHLLRDNRGNTLIGRPICRPCTFVICSEKESSRGDRAVWGTDGSGGVGLLSASSSRLDVKFAYDVVFSAGNDNGQVGGLSITNQHKPSN